MILRGLAGLIIGIGYGILMGALTFLMWRITHDPAYPGPMIPDDNGWRLIATISATATAGVCGALVGLLVSLTSARKGRGGVMGLAVGVVVLLVVFLHSWKLS
jgi:hypothetical protein